jgi:hypothetical protein
MSANEKQHGGAHYKKNEYQHWDFATDLDLPYLIGCASKYLTRWQDKNGREDLLKCDHYLEKAIERGLEGVEPTDDNVRNLQRFVGQLPELEAEAVYDMTIGNFQAARDSVAGLLALTG